MIPPHVKRIGRWLWRTTATSAAVVFLGVVVISVIAEYATTKQQEQHSQFVRMAHACEAYQTFEIDGHTYTCVNWPRNGD